jgi:hypothetical protein
VLTASTSEAYAWLFKLLCDPGDEVLIPTPSYPLFECLARLEAVRTVSYPLLREEAFRIDIAMLRARIGERTRAIVVVAPNNPTGSLVHEEDAHALDEIAREHGLALVVDEVFADYLFASPSPALRRSFAGAAMKSTCFVLSGLSKVLLSPQLKLGWVLVGGPQSDELMHRLSVIADTFLSVSSPAQLALPALLSARHTIQSEMSARLAENMKNLERLTADSTSRGAHAAADGWLVGARRSPAGDERRRLVTLSHARPGCVQPGWFYDIEDGGTLVLSLIVEPSRFQLGSRGSASWSLDTAERTRSAEPQRLFGQHRGEHAELDGARHHEQARVDVARWAASNSGAAEVVDVVGDDDRVGPHFCAHCRRRASSARTT